MSADDAGTRNVAPNQLALALLTDDVAEAIQTQIDEARDWMKFMWSEYLKWFAVFFALNVTGLGTLRYLDPSIHRTIELVALGGNILGTGTSICVLYYSLVSSKKVIGLKRVLFEHNVPAQDRDRLAPLFRPLTPAILGSWVGFTLLVGLILFAVIWARLFMGITALPGGGIAP